VAGHVRGRGRHAQAAERTDAPLLTESGHSSAARTPARWWKKTSVTRSPEMTMKSFRILCLIARSTSAVSSSSSSATISIAIVVAPSCRWGGRGVWGCRACVRACARACAKPSLRHALSHARAGSVVPAHAACGSRCLPARTRGRAVRAQPTLPARASAKLCSCSRALSVVTTMACNRGRGSQRPYRTRYSRIAGAGGRRGTRARAPAEACAACVRRVRPPTSLKPLRSSSASW